MTRHWSNYFLDPDFAGFWSQRLNHKGATVCLVIGVGFDPRCLTVADLLAQSSPSGVDCIAIVLRPPSTQLSENYQKLEDLTQENLRRLRSIGNLRLASECEISLRDNEGHLVGGRLSAKLLAEAIGEISRHRDIIVDISGLPRTIFYPIIAYLNAKAIEGVIQNLHVAVTEDSELDRKIRSSEFGAPDFLYPFRPEEEGEPKLVWMPVLSTSETNRLEKIHNQIDKNCVEICPVLPFPARDLRRADEIVMRMRTILFERMLVSHDNLLLCDEKNPFDIYRKILDVNDYYRNTVSGLEGLGEVSTVVSPLASKMLSLGMLLAAIEGRLSVTYAEAGSYRIEGDMTEFNNHISSSPVEIWLAGEPYE